MENKKITKRVRLAEIKEVLMNQEVVNTELVAFIDHEVEILDRKRLSTSKAKQAKNVADEELTEIVISVMQAVGKPMRVGEIIKSEKLEISGSKCTALLGKLVKAGKAQQETVKGNSFYKLV